MSEPLKSLPILPLDDAALRRTLTKQFASTFGMGPIPFPDHLVLKSIMAVGAVAYKDDHGETHLGGNDPQFLSYGLPDARAAGLPLLFDGNFTVINRSYGSDFLDYAKGIKQGQADIIFSCYVHNPEPSLHGFYHPQGFDHAYLLDYLSRHASDSKHTEGVARDIDNSRYYGISGHIPFDGDVGSLFADSAKAVGARAIIVFGGDNTINVPQYAHGPYVYVGQIHFTKPGVSMREWLQYPGHLLLDRDYLAELTAFAASRGITYPLSKQPIPVELHPHLHEVGHQFGWDPKTRTSVIQYLPEPQA